MPLLALLVATFSIPSGLGGTATIAWALVSYALFSLAYSFVNIPYGSLAAAMTQEPGERAKLSSARSVSASVTILAIAVVVAPQIEGGGDLQRSLTVITVVFGAIGLGLYLWCFATSREAARRPAQKVGVRETIAMIRHNRPLVLLCLSTLLFLTGMFSLSTVAVFYARDVLGNADYYILMTAVQTLAMVGAAAAVPYAVATLGKKLAFVLAGAIAAVSAAGFAFAPASVPALAIVCYGVLGVGFGAVNALIFALQADTVEYGEWKSGVRAEGASYSVLSFTRKAGAGSRRRGGRLHDRLRRLRLGRGEPERRGRHLDQDRSRRRAGGRRRGGGGGHARLSADREGVQDGGRRAGGAARGTGNLRRRPSPAHESRAGDGSGRLPRRGAGLVGAVGRASLGGHARR